MFSISGMYTVCVCVCLCPKMCHQSEKYGMISDKVSCVLIQAFNSTALLKCGISLNGWPYSLHSVSTAGNKQ